jgi:signal transduction histidine kinase/CheY-like chemotaxis protein
MNDPARNSVDHWTTAQRVTFLAKASSILASLDYRGALAALAQHIVPAIADWWTADILQSDGERISRVVAYARPPRAVLAQALVGRYPVRREAHTGPFHVLETGRIQILTQVSHPSDLALADDLRHLETVHELGLGPAICVPIIHRGNTLGVMTFVRTHFPYRPTHMALARTLGTQVGHAVAQGRMYEELQNANRAKDEFLAMLGHELRNPLAALTNAVAVLERAPVPPEVQASLQAIIARQTRHLTKLVAELLDVARLTRGKIVLEPTPIDLHALAERCVATFHNGGKSSVPRIQVTGEPTVVLGDSLRLEQVLDNLLDNASKFTPPGGRIDLSVESDEDHAILRVKDTGLGVAPELLPRMFEPFTQGSQGIERDQGGLGLGLAIVQRLVDLHGGSVQAFSPGPGGGTEVAIRLPLASSLGVAPEWPASATVDHAASHPQRRCRILVVEDNADTRETLRLLLELGGHQVELAEDGLTGCDAVRAKRPEVALIDLGLPRLDGYAVARHIRGEPGGGKIRLIALTGYGQPDDRRRAAEAGFDACLVKPVDRASLERAIAASLKSSVG